MSWTVIYSSSQPHLIEIVKHIFNDHSIQHVTVDKSDSMYKSALGPAIELHVQKDDVLLAKKLISEFENQ